MSIKLLKNILMDTEPAARIRANEEYIFSLIPELKSCKGFDQNNVWHIYDVYEHILKVVEGVSADLKARFVALFHDVGKPAVYHIDENGVGHFRGHWEKSVEVFKSFAKIHDLNSDFIESVSKLIFYHDINFGKMCEEELDKVAELFDDDELKLLFKIKRADLLAQNPKFHDLLNEYDIQEKMLLQRRLK